MTSFLQQSPVQSIMNSCMLPGMCNLVQEWQWLLSFSAAIRSASALTNGRGFPRSFMLLKKDASDEMEKQPEIFVSNSSQITINELILRSRFFDG